MTCSKLTKWGASFENPIVQMERVTLSYPKFNVQPILRYHGKIYNISSFKNVKIGLKIGPLNET
jgi:hypothetical protein